MSSLADLFPAEDFRHHLTLRRGEPRTFFEPSPFSAGYLAERRRWLESAPHRYAALQPEGEPLLQEFAAMCESWSDDRSRTSKAICADQDRSTGDRLLELGCSLEPDFLLLSADERGEFRLRGGALCFPTGWALEEKLGQTMDFIHGVVPKLNRTLALPIHQFLTRLKPGSAFLRDNWGLAASAELNLHPSRSLPAPALPVSLDALWLRVEHQALLRLPQTGGVVFGIAIRLHRLDQVVFEPVVRSGLLRALRSMPEDMIAYKRLSEIRTPLISLLASEPLTQ